MVQAMSLFNQLLQHFPKLEFAALVKKHNAEKAAKGFRCRTQLVAMLFCQLAHAESLREICNGLACCLGKLVHLGIDVAPSKSTLSYANQHRPAKLYEELFYTALARFRDEKGLGNRKQKFRFKNKLLSLDSTTIQPVPGDVSMGEVPSAKGWREGPCPARSRRLPAFLRPDHRSPLQRREDGRFVSAQPRLHCGYGSRLQRLRALWQVD
jgi:hypothetical protein